MNRNYLKCHSTSLYCSRNQNNIRYPNVQMELKNRINNINVLYIGPSKIFRKHDELCLEMTGSKFSVVVYVFILIQNFSTLCDKFTQN